MWKLQRCRNVWDILQHEVGSAWSSISSIAGSLAKPSTFHRVRCEWFGSDLETKTRLDTARFVQSHAQIWILPTYIRSAQITQITQASNKSMLVGSTCNNPPSSLQALHPANQWVGGGPPNNCCRAPSFVWTRSTRAVERQIFQHWVHINSLPQKNINNFRNLREKPNHLTVQRLAPCKAAHYSRVRAWILILSLCPWHSQHQAQLVSLWCKHLRPLTPASLAWNSHIALTSRQHPKAGFEYVWHCMTDSYLWSVCSLQNAIIRQSYIIHLLDVCIWLLVHVFTSWPPLGLPIDFANHPLGEAICSWSPIHGVGLPSASYAVAEYGDLAVKQSQESAASIHTMCWGTVSALFFSIVCLEVQCRCTHWIAKRKLCASLGNICSTKWYSKLFVKIIQEINSTKFPAFRPSSADCAKSEVASKMSSLESWKLRIFVLVSISISQCNLTMFVYPIPILFLSGPEILIIFLQL